MRVERKDPDPIPTPPSTFSLLELSKEELEFLYEITKVPMLPNLDTYDPSVNNGVEIPRDAIYFAITLGKRVRQALKDYDNRVRFGE